MDIHVFVFEHRHGRDITVHACHEAAYEAAARIARRDWAEAREREPSLPESPPADHVEAVDAYFTAQEGVEFYEIVGCQVVGVPAGAP